MSIELILWVGLKQFFGCVVMGWHVFSGIGQDLIFEVL